MSESPVVATQGDRERVVRSLVAAFTHDPLIRFLFPDDTTYEPLATAFFAHLFDRRVSLGTVWTIANGASAALWQPPAGADQAPEAWPAHLPADALAGIHEYDEAVHAVLPTEPHWYLGVLGTHPDHTGRRLGHAVMRAGLERAAAQGLPAYLETSNPGNVPVYEKAGWRTVRPVPAAPVPTWIMTTAAP